MEKQSEENKPVVGGVRRLCRILRLRPGMAQEYRHRHSATQVWPEIVEGIRSVGILEMELWNLGDQAVMILEIPENLDLDKAMERLATLPRQQEWEDYMSIFQVAEPGQSSAEKWQPMERVFHLYSPQEMAPSK